MIESNLKWSVHPLRQNRPFRSLSLISIILVISVIVSNSFGSIGFGFLSLIILVGSMFRYFFPSRYILDEKGVHWVILGYTINRCWSEFKRCEDRKNGVFLSTFVKPHRLDAFQGLFIPYNQNRESVLNIIDDFFYHRSV